MCISLIMIRQPGIDNGGFVVSPDSVWYARFLLLSRHLLRLTLDPSPSIVRSCRRWNYTTIQRMVIISIMKLS